MSDVIVIGVAGGTGSGKTTLVKALMNRFGDNISVLSHDNYYKRHDEMSYEERTHLNYDCPDAFDTDMMIEHLRMLKNGQPSTARRMTIPSTTAPTGFCTSSRARSSWWKAL